MDTHTILNHCLDACTQSRELLQKLGSKGRAALDDEHVVDISTQGDMDVSQFLIEYFQKTGIEAVYWSEESGQMLMGDNPKYTITTDDIDGTLNYSRDPYSQPHCTVITIFDSPQPKFCDVLVTAVIEHVSGRIWHAVRGEGCYVTKNGTTTKVSTNNVSRMSKRKDQPPLTQIIIDMYMTDDNIERMKGINTHSWVKDFGSAAYHLAGISSGIVDGYATAEQKAHELGAGYLLITEAGGSVLDHDGQLISQLAYDFNAKYPIVAAATQELALDMLEKLE